ncbi:alpha-glucan family phosphorylase [Luteibacter yeojuensis]
MHPVLPRALPGGLEGLTELALDLRWTWNHAVDALWQEVDPDLWHQTHNPWVVLQNVSRHRLDELDADEGFTSRLDRAVDGRRRYFATPGLCAATPPEAMPRTIAYFSMEFGLSEALPLYAGGLGVLAGDYLKTASDLGVPMLGIGLLYQQGYFRQTIDSAGNQDAVYPYNDPTSLPIQPVFDPDGSALELDLPLPGRTLRLRVWRAQVGRVDLYLLDSNHVSNAPVDRGITSRLYGGGPEMRLLQEVVLGIGGWRLLEALGVDVDVCHLNEGHAALLVLERARRCMHERRLSFREAWWITRAGNVFTTHTPVAAGFDAFAPALIHKYAKGLLTDCGISLQELLALGRVDPDDDAEPFNMTYLAMRGCAQSSAVSRLHGEVSRRLFERLYPRWPAHEVPVRHVTNGVHMPSWDSAWADALWTSACGQDRWLRESTCLASVATCEDDELWELAANQRADLVHYTRDRLALQLGQRGEDPARVSLAGQVLDPNILTLGMARRFAEYKRMTLLLHDEERLVALLTNAARPVQLIVAGKAHPDDEQGKQQVRAWLEFARRPGLASRVVFLEDYDLAVAQHLVQGVDAWINTPRPPWEACGTSGMKTLVNGGLNVSTLDGWWAEAYDAASGWAIDGGGGDAEDAHELYRLLEEEIVPSFYERDVHDIPRRWVARMRASMTRLAPGFSSNRMLLAYLDDFYRPATRALRKRKKTDSAPSLAQWSDTVASHWHEVRFGDVDITLDGEQWRFRAHVYLGDLPLAWVRAELYAEEGEGLPMQCIPMREGASVSGVIGGYEFSASVPASYAPGRYTVRVRPWHDDAFLPAELPFVAWQR